MVAENIASQRSLSWETRIDSNYEDKLRGYASFELVVSRRNTGREGYADELIGNENVVYPPWILRAGLSTDLRPSWKLPLQASIEGIYVAPRAAADASILENGGRFELPSYFWLNASLATPKLLLIPGHETTIALRGKNLLGVSGPDPGFSGFELPLVAREIMLELRHPY